MSSSTMTSQEIVVISSYLLHTVSPPGVN
jgi:hypothetical protein